MGPDVTIKDAIRKLNENARQILVVVDGEGRLRGTLTDGDIRRGILKDIPLDGRVHQIMGKNPQTLHETDRHKAKDLIKERMIPAVPIVDDANVVLDVVFRRDEAALEPAPNRDNLVFVMAGGRGTRLDPLTNILPKPLIPLGQSTMIEVLLKNFTRFGFRDFVLSLNYKGEMIKYFLSDIRGDHSSISFVTEPEYLGTAGSLYLIKDRVKAPFFVSNCDVVADVDFGDFLQHHERSGNDATILGVVRHVRVPYGVMEMQGGEMVSMKEKPEFDFIVNAGIYLLNPDTLRSVNDRERIDMPDLLERIKRDGMRVGIYPVSGEMIDVGQWEEYGKAIDYLRRFKIIDS